MVVGDRDHDHLLGGGVGRDLLDLGADRVGCAEHEPAADLGLPYAFADFINSDGGADIAKLYRERFTDSERLLAPRTAVAVWAIAADTEAEAQRLAYSSRMAMAMLRRGRLIAVPPVEKAERFLKGEGLLDKAPGRRLALGTPDRVRAELESVAASYEADEVIVVSITFDHEARRRSYELIAEAFGLRAQLARVA